MCWPSPIFKPGNLRCVKFDFSVKSDQGSQRRPKGIAVYVNFSIPPSLVITQIKKSLKITFSSISPYSQHFIYSLLPTFSPRFLPPPYFFRPFLPPPYCVPPPSKNLHSFIVCPLWTIFVVLCFYDRFSDYINFMTNGLFAKHFQLCTSTWQNWNQKI